MFALLRSRARLELRFLLLTVSAAALFSIWACGNKTQPSIAQTSPKNFASPDDAGKGLFEAAQSGNQDAVLAIFGAANKEIIYTGDAAEDKASLNGFARAYQVMNRWRKL